MVILSGWENQYHWSYITKMATVLIIETRIRLFYALIVMRYVEIMLARLRQFVDPWWNRRHTALRTQRRKASEFNSRRVYHTIVLLTWWNWYTRGSQKAVRN